MAKKLDPMAMRVAMERSLIDTRALVQNKNFESLEEANAYLQEVLKEGGPPPAPADTPLKRAQQIAYDAMEASGRRRVVLARRALEVSEDCADAWVLLAEEQRSLKAALEYAQKGVAAGERALGEEYFEEGVGCFWGDVDTRPYMRALMLYADILWAVGDKDEAIEVYQRCCDLIRAITRVSGTSLPWASQRRIGMMSLRRSWRSMRGIPWRRSCTPRPSGCSGRRGPDRVPTRHSMRRWRATRLSHGICWGGGSCRPDCLITTA
ncbi:MAG: tetratricopeptide repeat protein [Methanoculleus sp.]